MNIKTLLLISCCLSFFSCSSQTEKKATETVIAPIALDLAFMSGLNLKAVKDPKQPDRKLFQKNLYRGSEISVYVVSSESATAYQEDYGIDEFLYLINGGARLAPKDEKEAYYYTGDFFIVPKGYVGDWETIGGTEYHHELSVISTARNKKEVDPKKIKPLMIDKAKMSGIGITKIDKEKEIYLDTIYVGHEVTIVTAAEESTTKEITTALKEQLIYVIAGSVNLTDKGGNHHVFFAGDFFILPAGFTGKWESKGHHLFRSMSVTKTNWE